MKKELINIPTRILQLISSEQAYHYRIIPYMQANGCIYFKTDSSEHPELISELQIILNTQVVLASETFQTIELYLQKNYRKRMVVSKVIHLIILKIFS